MEHQFPSSQVPFTFFIFLFMVLRIWRKLAIENSIPNLPPGPWKLPFIGNLHQFVGSLAHHRLRDLAKKYGPLMHLQLGEVANIVVSSAEAAKEVMKIHDVTFAQRPYFLTADIVSYNSSTIAFSPYGDYWRHLRKICTMELLGAKRVQSFRLIREEEVSNLISSINSNAGMPINLSKMLYALTFDITSRAPFGKKCKDREAFKSVMEEIMGLSKGFGIADIFPSFKSLHSIIGMGRKLEIVHRKADQILENIINEDRPRDAATNSGDEIETDDLGHVLLNLPGHGKHEISLTTDNIKAVILDMFLGGTETSFTVLDWAIVELLRNPRVMEKAQAEVRQVFCRAGNIDETKLQQLKYLKLVVKETLRLHPPLALLLPRESRESCEINGFKIPAKIKVIINAWAIGRDPAYWNEPEKFHPERFRDSLIDYKGANFEYIPFGAGRRICPGISFGTANVEYPLAQLLYHFNWKLPSGLKQENLDMNEAFGVVVRRKEDLNLIPISYYPLSTQ